MPHSPNTEEAVDIEFLRHKRHYGREVAPFPLLGSIFAPAPPPGARTLVAVIPIPLMLIVLSSVSNDLSLPTILHPLCELTPVSQSAHLLLGPSLQGFSQPFRFSAHCRAISL